MIKIHRKRLAIPYNRIWTIQLEWEECDACTGYIMGFCPHYSRKCEHIPFLFILRLSRARLWDKKAKEAHTFFIIYTPHGHHGTDAYEKVIYNLIRGNHCHVHSILQQGENKQSPETDR